MPQKGWLCVFSGGEKTFNECIACSKTPSHCEFTPEMLASMRRGVSSSKKNPRNPSVTQILKECLRQVVIQDRYDYHLSPRRNWFLFRGNMIHQILEGSLIKDGWKELYQSREIDLGDDRVVEIGGKVDKLVMSKLLIRDYKTARRLPTKARSSYGTHDLQLNVYRWIWWPIFHADKLRLSYIDMSGTKQVKVELMDIDEVEETIRTKARAYVDALEGKDLPESVFDSKNWVCRYCDVKDICEKLNKE